MIDPLEAFLSGWLDAIWSGFRYEYEVRVPRDVQRELIRRGWLRPISRKDESGFRDASITPAGVQAVIDANIKFNINRVGWRI